MTDRARGRGRMAGRRVGAGGVAAPASAEGAAASDPGPAHRGTRTGRTGDG